MEDWKIYAKRADFNAIGQQFHIDPVIARVIRNRDIVTEEEFSMYFSSDISKLHNPWLLKDMDKAIDIITAKVAQNKKIRVIGDYDIDGICSIYILMRVLKDIGADASYAVPHRITDGYGVNENIIDKAHLDGIDTIITCDNGIAAKDAVDHAKSLGMTVIITDHHNIPYEESEGTKCYIIPDADAVINPKQEFCDYPYKEICGGYVAFKLASCLYERFNMKDRISKLIVFAAIATIGDIMPLKEENRILVKQGLKDIRNTDNIGLKMLIDMNSLDASRISSYDVGFRLGPCLNASGRLETAELAVKLFMSDKEDEAIELAQKLVLLNNERKNMTELSTKNAIEMVENSELSNDSVLVVYLPECHESIVGIVAGRVREYFNKPTLVITDAENGVKGSARSIEHYNMFEELTRCKELFDKFGGHPMAAGFSLKKENVDTLRRSLNENSTLTEKDFVKTIWIDVPMPVSYITEKLVNELTLLEPFGNGNEKPLFAEKNLYVRSLRVFGKNRNVAKLVLVSENGKIMDAVYFGDADKFAERVKEKNKYSFAYYPSVNEYNGRKNLQIVIQAVR